MLEEDDELDLLRHRRGWDSFLREANAFLKSGPDYSGWHVDKGDVREFVDWLAALDHFIASVRVIFEEVVGEPIREEISECPGQGWATHVPMAAEQVRIVVVGEMPRSYCRAGELLVAAVGELLTKELGAEDWPNSWPPFEGLEELWAVAHQVRRWVRPTVAA
ncbi:MAG: hypothetical protein ACRBN8_46860 [Nannocystales bacterium]